MKVGAARVWLFTALLASLTIAALWAAHQLPVHVPQPELPWWLVALLFAAAESWVFHFEFRREAHSFSLSEVPFVLGLFGLRPLEFIVALAVGAAFALAIVRRQAPVKFAFNLAQMCLGGAIGLIVFEAFIVVDGSLSTTAAIGALAATLTAGIVGTVAIAVAISLAEGRPSFGKLAVVLSLSMVITVTNTSMALIAVTILVVAPDSIWLLVIPIVTVALAYRAYVSERSKHETLEFLFESSRILQRSPELETSMLTLLDHMRRMFRADVAEILLTGQGDLRSALRTTVGPGDEHGVLVPTTVDPLSEETLRLDRPRRLAKEPGSAHLLERRDGRALRDAIVTPIRSETRVLGVMLLANRAGDVTTFTDDDLRILETLAAQAGVALENGQLERNIGQLVELRDQLHHQAFHDSLTGLANRPLFVQHLREVLASRPLARHAVLFLDVDDFKVVNDSLGHAAGDALLREVGLRTQACIRDHDLAARLGGDEFAVLLADLPDERSAHSVVHRLLATIRAPVVIDGIEVAARVSIGVAFTDQGDVTADSLLRNADVAMYSAKARGKGRSATFVPEMHTAVVERHSLGADLAHAVRRGELTLHYQPIVELATGVTVGFESLVRWNHPRRGLLDPGRFIALAEETGAIAELGSWTVEAACRQFGEWQEADLGQGFVAVNLSGHNLTSPAIDRQIAASLAATGLSPSLLTVELTETVLVHDAEVAAQRLRAIRELGVKVAIDDFGTGYSSLNYLHQLPVDILKIARDFVDRITTDEGAATLTTAMIALAGALGLEVIAEGIEHPEQLRRLREMGCQLGQGFWYARPMPASLVPRWISEHEASRPAAIALDHGAPAPSPGAGLVRRDGLARASH